jgi:D-alanine-D-alanine ligase-like ATP-grasp enzyme
MTKEIRCTDCGPNFVHHRLQYTSARLEWMLLPMVSWTEGLWKKIRPIAYILPVHKVLIPLFKFLHFTRISKIVTHSKDEADGRSKCFWEEAERRGIEMYKFHFINSSHVTKGVFVANINGKKIIFDTLPRPGGNHSPSIEWMDDKAVMREKFKAAGLAIARGGCASSFKEALEIFNSIGGEVIVKPRTGSRSRHTTTYITTPEALKIAYDKAKQLSPWVVVEEQLRGLVFRVTLIGGKVIAIMRREPPYVVGDGVRTLQELINEENKHPARKGPVFHEIVLDEEGWGELKRQNLTMESVPEKGRFVALGQKIGRGSGGSTSDATENVHPENIKLFEKIGAYLQDPLVGVDFIIEDMARPWQEQMPCGVIECNSLPFIDLHHFPMRGEVKNTASALWDYVLSYYSQKN